MANIDSALKQLRNERQVTAGFLARIDAAIKVLDGAGANTSSRKRVRRKMSAEARRRIAAAQKARWAKWRRRKG